MRARWVPQLAVSATSSRVDERVLHGRVDATSAGSTVLRATSHDFDVVPSQPLPWEVPGTTAALDASGINSKRVVQTVIALGPPELLPRFPLRLRVSAITGHNASDCSSRKTASR